MGFDRQWGGQADGLGLEDRRCGFMGGPVEAAGMTRLVVGTDSVDTSERLAAYLGDALGADDEVVAINSLVGGDETTPEELDAGEDALAALVDELGEHVVERHQFVRGNKPVQDLLAAAEDFDADEIAIGIRKRSPVGKMVFGSTAQNLLLESDLPVRCFPLVSD